MANESAENVVSLPGGSGDGGGGGNASTGDRGDRGGGKRKRRGCDGGYADIGFKKTWRQMFPGLIHSREKTARIMSMIFDMEEKAGKGVFLTPKRIAYEWSEANPMEALEGVNINNIFNFFAHDDVEYLLENVIAAIADVGKYPNWVHRREAEKKKVNYALRTSGFADNDVPQYETGNPEEDERLGNLARGAKNLGKRGGNRGRAEAKDIVVTIGVQGKVSQERIKTISEQGEVLRIANRRKD